MAESKAAICNVALNYVGTKKQIANLSEQNQEAGICKLNYDPSRKEVLQEINWPFARKYVDLGMVQENPTLDWAYSFRYPSDCLKIRRIVTSIRNDPNPPPYEIGQDDQGKLVYCDLAEVTIEYTKNEEDPTRFDAYFDDALSWKIGEKIAPSMARLKGAVERCERKYLIALSVASAMSFNEQEESDLPDSEVIRERN